MTLEKSQEGKEWEAERRKHSFREVASSNVYWCQACGAIEYEGEFGYTTTGRCGK